MKVLTIVLSLLVVGCSVTKGGLTDPGAVPVPNPNVVNDSPYVHPLSLVVGTWSGVTTASHGESGTLSATFTQPPTPDSVMAANLTWTSAQTKLPFHGTLTGTLDAMVINATDDPENGCGYNATGALNAAGTQITGTYSGTGPAPCPTKTGSFVLNGSSYEQSGCPTSFSYNGANPFTLSDASDTTELAYVKANVHNSLVSAGRTNFNGDATSWAPDGNYAVVIVKAGQKWYIYVNVHTGDSLSSQSFNSNEVRQAISHVSRFNCPALVN